MQISWKFIIKVNSPICSQRALCLPPECKGFLKFSGVEKGYIGNNGYLPTPKKLTEVINIGLVKTIWDIYSSFSLRYWLWLRVSVRYQPFLKFYWYFWYFIVSLEHVLDVLVWLRRGFGLVYFRSRDCSNSYSHCK